MTVVKIIDQARAEGIELRVRPDGNLGVRGIPEVRDRWLPILREHKPEILANLREWASTPANDTDPVGQEADRLAREATAAMRSGSIPHGWNQPLLCDGCGWVPWAVAGAAVLCPWCWVRMDGLPVPRITEGRRVEWR